MTPEEMKQEYELLLEEYILDSRKEGVLYKEILKELGLKIDDYYNALEKLKQKGLYDGKQERMEARKVKNKKVKEHKNKLSEEENEYRKKIIEFLSVQYFDYNRENRFSTIIPKELSAIAYKYSYKDIYFTMQKYKLTFNHANNKVFRTDYQKVKYFMAIVRDKIDKVSEDIKAKEEIQKRKEAREKRKKLDMIETTQIEVKKRTDLSDLIDD